VKGLSYPGRIAEAGWGIHARLPKGHSLPMLDFNSDSGVNLADAVAMFNFLVGNGQAPALGLECVSVTGCPAICYLGATP
jgi:hypothetical protein